MAFGLDLGNLIVHLRADDMQFNRTLLNAENRLKRTADKFSRIGRSMTMYVTAPIVALGVAATKSFASFDDAMTQSLAIMGDVTPMMRKEMETLARDISKTSITSATDLAKSYFYLASAGLSAEQSITSLAAVEKFAVAGRFDMALATDLATDAQSALGLTVKDAQKNLENMTRVTDVLVGANTLANATVQQFSESLTSQAGPAMKSYNIELEEGVAVLAAYADQGIKAQVAGSMLGRMLRLMAKGFQDNRQAWDQFNIDIYDATRNLRPLWEIINDLSSVLESMSTEQKVSTLTMLGFQARSQQAILPLIGLGDQIKYYNELLIKMRGITEEIAEKQLKSFSSQMRIMWHNVTDVARDIGGMLAPHIIKLNKHITRATDFWHSLNDSVKQNILYYAGLVAVIGPLLMVTGLLIKSLSLVIGTVRTLVGWLGGLAAAIASPLIVVVALAAIAYVLRAAWVQNLSAIKDRMKDFVDSAKYYFDFLANSIIGKFVVWMYDTFKEAFTTIGKGWKEFIADIVALTAGAMAALRPGGKTFFEAYADAYEKVLSKMVTFEKVTVRTFKTGVIAVKAYSEATIEHLEDLMDAVKMQFGEDTDAIVALIRNKIQQLQTPMDELREASEKAFGEKMMMKETVRAIEDTRAALEGVAEITEDVVKTTMTLADAYRAMRGEMGRMTEEIYKAQLKIIKGLYKEYEEAGVSVETLKQWYKEQIEILEIDYLKAIGGIWGGFKAAGLQIKREMTTWGERAYEFSMTLENSIASGLENSLRDFKNWKNHLLDMFEEIYWSAIRIAFIQPFAGALAGGMTAALGGLFTGGGAGMPTAGTVTPAAGATLARYQHGGLAMEPQMAIVGDVPELITPVSDIKNLFGRRDEGMEININYTGRERHEVNVEESVGALKQQVLTITMDAMQHNVKYRKSIKQASR